MKPLFITAIGTDVGKTVISAMLVEKLQADYWKPVQSGDLDNTDTDKVKKLVSNPVSVFHSEIYRLSQPFSPHKSAALDAVKIDLKKIILPQSSNRLIIEGAGGLMVPLNEKNCIVDLISQLGAEVILVSKHYLGSINHTLLSIDLLKNRGIPIKGLIFNGHSDQYSEDIILKMTGINYLGTIPYLDEVDKDSIREAAHHLNQMI